MNPRRAMTVALRLACALVVASMLGVSVRAQVQPADAARCTDQDLEALRREWNLEPDVTVYDAACKAWPDDARLRSRPSSTTWVPAS
jgi:hypothetical protein